MLLDFLPIILFFATYMVANAGADAAARFATEHLGSVVSGGVVGADVAPVLLATVVVLVATFVQIAVMLAMRRKVHLMLWVTFGLVAVLGGATVWFHNPDFIKWKPSVVCWGMALVLLVSQSVFGKNLLKAMIGKQLPLPPAVWQRLNTAWVLFLVLTGVVNYYVAFNFSMSTWVSFKLFGLTAMNLLFMLAQGAYIAPHLPDEAPAPARRVDDAKAPLEREPG